jgi:hypothetical protein
LIDVTVTIAKEADAARADDADERPIISCLTAR